MLRQKFCNQSSLIEKNLTITGFLSMYKNAPGSAKIIKLDKRKK